LVLKKLLSRFRSSPDEHKLPDGHLVYAVGDVHGRAELLIKLVEMIRADISKRTFTKATLVFLGDYIDRGYQSKEVLDYLIDLQIPGVEIEFLAGNHEDMLMQFLVRPEESEVWLRVGGTAALASYGVFVPDGADVASRIGASNELKRKIPKSHLAFLKDLKEHFRVGDYLFVHAGLRPGVPLDAQRRRDKLGIRGEFTEMEFDFGMRVVHGHTGVRRPVVTPNRVAIDTGAFATGVLTAVVVSASGLEFLQT